MKTHNCKRSALLTVGVVLIGLSLACVVWVKKEQRQYALNRQLIDSLATGDFKRALELVEAGADPNTLVERAEAPTWCELFGQLWYHSPAPVNNSPTAFMAVCGDLYNVISAHSPGYAIPLEKWEDPQLGVLQKSMLHHGANVNARDAAGGTALMYETYQGLTDRMTVLLQNGAAIDLQDNKGDTALHYAIESIDLAGLTVLLKNYGVIINGKVEDVKLLIKYHANPNVRNHQGHTPLGCVSQEPASPEIIRLLKAAGAKE